MKEPGKFTSAARWALPLLLILGAQAQAQAQAGRDDRRLEQQMAGYWAEYLEAYPLIAAGFGAQGPRDVLDDFGPEARAAQVKRLDDYIEALGKVRVNKLSPASREQFDAYSWMLRNERANLDHNSRYFTFNTVVGWHTMLAQIFLALPYFNEKDYRDLLSRMSQVVAQGALGKLWGSYQTITPGTISPELEQAVAERGLDIVFNRSYGGYVVGATIDPDSGERHGGTILQFGGRPVGY